MSDRTGAASTSPTATRPSSKPCAGCTKHADGDDDRPFALTVSFISPHDPYLAPPRWWEGYDDVEIDPPRVADIPLDARDPHSRRHWFLTGRHRAAVEESDVLRMRRAYYALTSYIDAKVGRLLETLGEIGAAEDTLVVFTSDHGDSLGERGLFFKMSFFEWSVRVPLIVHAPFAFAPRRVRANVSHLDLFPTLLEAAGDGALPELAAPIDGRSLAPLAARGGLDWPDLVCAEYTAEGVRAPLLMVRKGPAQADIEPRRSAVALRPSTPTRTSERILPGGPPAPACARSWKRSSPGPGTFEPLDAAVRESQSARRLVGAALDTGTRTPWDYQPMRDASRALLPRGRRHPGVVLRRRAVRRREGGALHRARISEGAPPCRLSPILSGPDADGTNEPGLMESRGG